MFSIYKARTTPELQEKYGIDVPSKKNESKNDKSNFRNVSTIISNKPISIYPKNKEPEKRSICQSCIENPFSTCQRCRNNGSLATASKYINDNYNDEYHAYHDMNDNHNNGNYYDHDQSDCNNHESQNKYSNHFTPIVDIGCDGDQVNDETIVCNPYDYVPFMDITIINKDLQVKDETINNRHNFAYKAITHISDRYFIFHPELVLSINRDEISNSPIIYNFDDNSYTRLIIDTEKSPEENLPYRITDATDMDHNYEFYLVDLNDGSQSYFTSPTNYCRIIKARLEEDRIVYVKAHNIPLPGDKIPNIECIARIGHNEFLLFSNEFTIHSGRGALFAVVTDSGVEVKEFMVNHDCNTLNSVEFDMRQFSSVFSTNRGVVLIPEFPGNYHNKIFIIVSNEINRLKQKVYSGKNEDIVIKMVSDTVLIRRDNNGNYYQGIEAMTIDNCGEVFGITEWGEWNKMASSRPLRGKILKC